MNYFRIKSNIGLAALFVSVIVFMCMVSFALTTSAQTPSSIPSPIGPNNVGANQGTLPNQSFTNEPTLNTNDSGFRLTVCDGPTLPKDGSVLPPANLGHTYVPCDFNGLMKQVQHLINIAILLGV